MGNIETSSYIVKEATTLTGIRDAQAGWYQELMIRNHYGRSIYLMQPDGSTYEVPSTYEGSVSDHRVVIRMSWRQGLQAASVGDWNGAYNINSPRFPQKEVVIKGSALDLDALYIKEFGIALATQDHKDRLLLAHRLTDDYFKDRFQRMYTDFFSSGHNSPVLISANSHTDSDRFLFAIINGKLSSVRIMHNKNMAPSLKIHYNLADGHTDIDFPEFDWKKSQAQVITAGADLRWIVGTSREAVMKLYTESQVAENNRYSAEELNAKISVATATAQDQIVQLQADKEMMTRELNATKKELLLTAAELQKANDLTRYSAEQELQSMRIRNAREENESLRERRDFVREQTREKSRSDLAIARSRERKEELSVRNAETSNFGTLAKTAAVLAPIIASAVVWTIKTSSSSAVAGLLGSAAGCMCPVLGVAGMTAMAISRRPRWWTRVKSFFTESVNSICSGVRRVWHAIWD